MSNVRRPHITVDQKTGYPADTGCEVAPRCLTCPLLRCKYDDPLWYQDWRRRQRDEATLASLRSLPATTRKVAVNIVAAERNITERTVYRILARNRTENGTDG